MLSRKLLISASTATTKIALTLLLLYAAGGGMLVVVAAAAGTSVDDNVVTTFEAGNMAISSKNPTINAQSAGNSDLDKSDNSLLPHNVASNGVNGSNNNNNNNKLSSSRKLQRGKRYLDFTKGTRMSWRTTVKNNILKVNTLWGHGFGFRANFPFADKADRRRPFFKRDLFHALEDVLDGSGFDGRACVLKSYCTAILNSESHLRGGMLFKLLQMIFSFVGIYFVLIALVQPLAAALNSTDKSSMRRSATLPQQNRAKRYLELLPTSRMFFRVNGKNNIIPKPTIWAHGYGFRANMPIDNSNKKLRPFRRDTYELLHDLMDKTGFDGQACVLKAFCAAHVGEGQGMLFKLLRHVFTLDSHDKRHLPYLREENCAQIMHGHCPLSFNSISPYTDDA